MASSVLDMTLDDVIKNKPGGGGGKRARGAGGRKGGEGGGGKLRSEGGKPTSKAAKNDKAPEKRPARPAGGGGKGTGRALGAALKAAAAAAKALATSDKPVAAAKAAGEGGAKAEKPKARAPPTKKVAAPKNTEDKLGMSLEDLLHTDGGRRGGKGEKGEKKKEAGDGEKRVGRRGGRLKLRREKGRAQAKAKAKGGKAAKGRGGGGDDWGRPAAKGGAAAAWGGSKESSWDGHDDRLGGGDSGRGGKSGGKGDWGPPKRKAAARDDWGPPPAKRTRMADRDSFGWGGGRDAGWGPPARDAWGAGSDRDWDYWGGSSGSGRSAAAGRVSQALGWGSRSAAWERGPPSWERGPPPTRGDAWGAGPREFTTRSRVASAGGTAPPTRVSERTSVRERDTPGTRIKVTNVPLNLDWRDIKEAFEDNGRVTKCEVDRGVAWVIFERASDAKKAVATFDRGELNGQTIYVTPEA